MSHSGSPADDDDGESAPVSRKKKAPHTYPPMLMYWDKHEVCRFINDASLEWFNHSAEHVIGKMDIRRFVGNDLYNENRLHIRSVLSGLPQFYNRTLKIDSKGELSALISLIPDIRNGQTEGFYAHVADVGQLQKKADARLADEKELLKAIINIQENERANIAEILRDNVNQLLVYVNLMLQGKKEEGGPQVFSDEMHQAIQQAVLELNNLSNQLYPSGLSLLGLLPSIENLISNFRQAGAPDISFFCNDANIEELSTQDKLSIYRIIQDFTGMILNQRKSSYIIIELSYRDFCLMIRIVFNGDGPVVNHQSDSFRDIRSRIDYYSGKMRKFHREDEQVFMAHLVFHPQE